MAYYGDKFLDQIRAAVSVRAAVERHHKLRRKGTNEWQAIDDPSLTVNDVKNIWSDFGNNKGGGDVFAYEQRSAGCTFEQAVETLAHIAGLPLPKTSSRRPQQSSHGPTDDGDFSPEPPPHTGTNGNGAARPREELTDVYQYHDADGSVLYEVVRYEWFEGTKKHKKTPPRRPAPGEPGRFIWGLHAGEHLRGRSGDWHHADAKKKRDWVGAESRVFDEAPPRTLMRMPEIAEERSQPTDEQRPVFCPEGESDQKTLEQWGLLATTSMGGTNGWLPYFAEYLSGMDVVILADNDQVGRKFAHEKALSLRPYARRVRVLDWRDHWPGVEEGNDVTDWRNKAGGTVEKLFEIVDKLPDWSPLPPETKLNALRFLDLDKPRRRLQWLIKGVMTRGEMSIWYGDWGTGKSFLLLDASFSVARGILWMGQRTQQGLVIYQAGEGEIGFTNRMLAYRQHNDIPADEDVPFVALPARINLFEDDKDTDKVIEEIKAWRTFYDLDLELVVLDTFSAASTGANENAGDDVGRVMQRARRIAIETGAHVAIVHHVPKGGTTPRGHSSFLGNVDSAIFVENVEQPHEEIDQDGTRRARSLHQMTVSKQKDAESRLSRQFVLPQIIIGKDGDGENITSCVVREVGSRVDGEQRARDGVPKGWYAPHPSNEAVLQALIRAIKSNGRPPPENIGAGVGVQAVTIAEWQEQERRRLEGHLEMTPTAKKNINKRIERACQRWEKAGLLIKEHEWVWRTSRRIFGVDEIPKPKVEQAPILAPGESPDDVTSLQGDGR